MLDVHVCPSFQVWVSSCAPGPHHRRVWSLRKDFCKPDFRRMSGRRFTISYRPQKECGGAPRLKNKPRRVTQQQLTLPCRSKRRKEACAEQSHNYVHMTNCATSRFPTLEPSKTHRLEPESQCKPSPSLPTDCHDQVPSLSLGASSRSPRDGLISSSVQTPVGFGHGTTDRETAQSTDDSEVGEREDRVPRGEREAEMKAAVEMLLWRRLSAGPNVPPRLSSRG